MIPMLIGGQMCVIIVYEPVQTAKVSLMLLMS